MQAFLRLLHHGIADFIMPDVGKAEGITGVKQVIEGAILRHVFYNPIPGHRDQHRSEPASRIGDECAPFRIEAESNPMEHELVAQPIDQNHGYVYVPEGPGLGIEVREDVVSKPLRVRHE